MLNCAIRTAARATSRRQMSTASPKMHKAKDVWGELKATRPPEGHPHVSNWFVAAVDFGASVWFGAPVGGRM
jgi:hypothetical protein